MSGDQGSISNQTISARPGTSIEATQSSVDDAPPADPPITITPASPEKPSFERQNQQGENAEGRHKLTLGRPRGQGSTGRRVSRILKTQVHRGQERISSISKMVALGPRQGLSHLRKTTSAPGKHSQADRRPSANQPRQICIRCLVLALSKLHQFIHEGESRTGTPLLTNLSSSLYLLVLLRRSRRHRRHRNGTTAPRKTGG